MPTFTRRSFIAQSFGLVLLAACASAPAAGPTSSGSSRDVLTRADLSDPGLTGLTVVEAIRRLRPRFLNARQNGLHRDEEGAQVSINGNQPGPLSDLARVELGDVDEIRYLNAADANLRFGLASAMRPVLVVTLRAR